MTKPHTGSGGKKPRRKRLFKLKGSIGPIRSMPAPDPESLMGRVSAADRERLRAQPELQAFVRPLVEGEFADIRVGSRAAMNTFTHVYVQRVDPTTVERARIPITAEQAQAFMERGTLDTLQSQTESAETAQDAVDDPFIFPQDSQRLTIVAAARGMYAMFHEYPHLEHDQDVLQGRAQQLIEYHLRLWPEMTNDVPAYTRLFTPAFLFGYRLGHAMLQEVNAEKRQTMVQGVRSMDNAAALIFLDLIIRDRMQEMGVKTIYELL
jgi:hypothetical protein